MTLKEYKDKRDLSKSKEPSGKSRPAKGNSFVIHKHAASHLHYDLRLEFEGVLKSWAIPKDLPRNQNQKVFAKLVEDHPIDYQDFEGNIPEGNYGAGSVMVYDAGKFIGNLKEGFQKGHIAFRLLGQKINADFDLVMMKNSDWLLISRESVSLPQDPLDDGSVKSKRLMSEIMLNKEIDFSHLKHLPLSEEVDIRPMLATDVGDIPFDDNRYFFETKLDGFRAIASIDYGRVSLFSRNINKLDQKFKIVHDELKKFKYKAVIDGEIVFLDREGRPNFEKLQNASPVDERLYYYVFDLLSFEKHDLRQAPVDMRKDFLSQLIPPNSRIRYLSHIQGTGKKYFTKIKKIGFEGMIAKKTNSVYRAGIRSRDWLKIKNIPIDDFVIVGFTQPKGTRNYFGSLVLAKQEPKGLKIYGNVGSGFSEQLISELSDKLKKIIDPSPIFKPKQDTVWIKPIYKARVKFLEKTKTGSLRHPSFISLIEPESNIRLINKSKESILKIDQTDVKIANPDKIFFPELKLTKTDLVNYYLKIAPYLLPYIKNRPQSLHRFPDGIYGEKFYHKNTDFKEKWLNTFTVQKNKEGLPTKYLVINNTAQLIYAINLACIELNPWLSKILNVERPDILVFDIDPGENANFSQACEVAFLIKDIFDKIGADLYVKTSGSRGLHIFLPIKPLNNFASSSLFCEYVASLIAHKIEYVSLERDPELRKDKVYIDFLQNNFGQTIASIYSIRPNQKALVSSPIGWDSLGKIKPDDFDYKTIFKNIEKNPWDGFFSKQYDLSDLLSRLKRLIKP